MMCIEFTVPGRLNTNHRVRSTVRGGKVRHYKAADYREYLERATACARAAMTTAPRDWPLRARSKLTITMHEHDRRSRDWDNVKAISDGCNRIVWNDDRQVDDARVIRGEVRKTAPCVVVRVEVLP